jgi:two-component system, chemotaxis family, chemotaxis protein CheY
MPDHSMDSSRRATTPEAEAAAAAQPSDAKTASLLIIEDAIVHSAIIARIADKLGFSTTSAHSYEDACTLVSAQQFDCITLDLGLGEHVGIDMLRYLWTIQCGAPIIVISQSDKETCDDVVELGRELGLNIYKSVPKPIDLKALRQTLTCIHLQSRPQQPTAANGKNGV